MNRRSFLSGTTGLIISSLGDLAPNGTAAEPNSWFDPSYSVLPTPEQQTKELDATALAAQTKPRTVLNMPVTGLPSKPNKFDEQMVTLVKDAGIVGLSFAVAINRQLTVTRGYGYLSSHDPAPAAPTSPGCIGSITKPLCAMAALTLVKAGKLKLDQKVVDILPMEPLLRDDEKRQPEIDQVTVRMLMNHTSGLFNIVEDLFDRDYYRKLAADGKLKLVHDDISQYDLVRRGMAKPFVSKPGTEFHYSGQGLQVLGRIVEKISGLRLDKYLSDKTLAAAPLGVKRHATLSYLAPKEFALIAAGKASKTGTFIPSPYNGEKKVCESWAFDKPTGALYGHHWGQADACGASMLSAVDLLRFVTYCLDPLGNDLAAEALTPPKVKDTYMGFGWGVSMNSGRYQYGHGGAITGCRAFCESTWDGVQYAVLVAGDRDKAVQKINETVVELGRSLAKAGAATVGWKRYGFK
jgi:CubicO group peptidase (beta-lactamase class C family)